jgi:methionyl-tRNA synthetase
METVLWTTAEVIRMVALLIQPYMPQSAAKFLDLLAVPEDARDFSHFVLRLQSGSDLPAPTAVFPRFVEEETKPA